MFKTFTNSIARTLGRIVTYILLGYVLFLLLGDKVHAQSINSYDTKYYFVSGYDSTTSNSTSYKPSTNNSITLYGDFNPQGLAPQFFTGFYTTFNHNFTKGVNYYITVVLDLKDLEGYDYNHDTQYGFRYFDYSTRLENYAKVSSGFTLISVSTSYNTSNCHLADSYIDDILCDYTVSIIYNVVPTSNTTSINIGSYNTSNYSFLFYRHSFDIIMSASSVNISQNSDDVIVDQNQSIIEGQEQIKDSITDSTDKITDSITNSDISDGNNSANNFFNNFENTDHGGLTGIVTAPLVSINAMLDGTCTPLSTEWRGKTISFPCGNYFWDNATDMKEYLNWFEGGIICYFILKDLYLLIEKLKNPDNDKIEVMNL